MDELKLHFPKAPPELFDVVAEGDLGSLIAFWARMAPQVDAEGDCSPELWDAMLLTTWAINFFGESMLSPEQAQASNLRALHYGPLGVA